MEVSPDEKQIALDRHEVEGNTSHVWIQELAGGRPRRFTSGSRVWTGHAQWSANSDRILFEDFATTFHVKDTRVETIREEISRGPRQTDAGMICCPQAWSRDERMIVLRGSSPRTKGDLWMLTKGDSAPVFYLRTEYNETQARLSPDSHWLAYVSNESGIEEVYVQSFPTPGQKKRISEGGGIAPIWREDGKEIYYVAHDALMSVAVTVTPTGVVPSDRRRLFAAPAMGGSSWEPQYAALSNGQRFLFNVRHGSAQPQTITVVFNWLAAAAR